MIIKTEEGVKYLIRKAEIKDANEVSELIIKCINTFHVNNYTVSELDIWKRGYTPLKVESYFSQRQSLVLVIDKEIAGIIQFEAPEIKGFYLKPKYFSKGIGRLLLEYIILIIKKDNHKVIELSSNKWIVAFYKKFGFTVKKEEIVYWENHPFIEYRMEKSL
jgi:ribosomal protein S18 acetylase RimI-like enzyme